MNSIQVVKLALRYNFQDLPQISKALDSQKREAIAIAPWPEYGYKPDVSFAIAHNGHSLFLKYYVTELGTRTVYTEINDPVYKDSCVEFFISFDPGQHYYNFEFNSRGVCLAGFGENRDDRELLSPAIIKRIDCLAISHPSSDDKNNAWQLCLAIPVDAFCYKKPDDLTGKSVRANFYKCGDDLAQPHFLTWSNIISKKPNFHLPQFFGELNFA
jgi:hypothetical protein